MSTGAARLLELAFDPAVEGHEDPISQRILDAALALVAASGLRHLTMDDVAARAGVGRMTVYRRFGSRQQLTDALAVRECRRCLSEIGAALDPAKSIDERAADLFLATLRVIREHPLLERLARVEPDALLYELNRDGSAVFRLVRDFLVAQIRVAQRAGELVEVDPEPLAEIAVRLGASFVLMPDSVIAAGDERRTRETIRALIAPVLNR
jgi:TetR/AcrR family transcriptional regulator, repressor for uid operon